MEYKFLVRPLNMLSYPETTAMQMTEWAEDGWLFTGYVEKMGSGNYYLMSRAEAGG